MNRVQPLQLWIIGIAIATFAATAIWGWQAAAEREGHVVVDGAVLGRIVTARDVDHYNRPTRETADFLTTDEGVYVVAEALHVDQGASVLARWTRDGQLLGDSITLVPLVDYRDTTIKFLFENTGGRLRPGTYQVTLIVNGQPATATDFVVAPYAAAAR